MTAIQQPLRRVPQRHWDGGDCGLACVAMVSRQPYEAVCLLHSKNCGLPKLVRKTFIQVITISKKCSLLWDTAPSERALDSGSTSTPTPS